MAGAKKAGAETLEPSDEAGGSRDIVFFARLDSAHILVARGPKMELLCTQCHAFERTFFLTDN